MLSLIRRGRRTSACAAEASIRETARQSLRGEGEWEGFMVWGICKVEVGVMSSGSGGVSASTDRGGREGKHHERGPIVFGI